MRPQLCLFAAFVFSTALSTISAFSFQGGKKNGLQIPKTGASPDLATAAASLSQKSVTKESNNQFMNYMPTRRDTIKMPSVTPMVPWTVRFVGFVEMELYERMLCVLSWIALKSIRFSSLYLCFLFLFCNLLKSCGIQIDANLLLPYPECRTVSKWMMYGNFALQ